MCFSPFRASGTSFIINIPECCEKRSATSAFTSDLRASQPMWGVSAPVFSSTSMPMNPAKSSTSHVSTISPVTSLMLTCLKFTRHVSEAIEPPRFMVLGMVRVFVSGKNFRNHPSNSVGFSLLQPPPRRRSGRSSITMFFQNFASGFPSAARVNWRSSGFSSRVHHPMS